MKKLKIRIPLLLILSGIVFSVSAENVNNKSTATKLLQRGFDLYIQGTDLETRANGLITNRTNLVKQTSELRQLLGNSTVMNTATNKHLQAKDFPADLYLLSEKLGDSGAGLRSQAGELKRYAKQLMDLGFNALWIEHLDESGMTRILGTGTDTTQSELLQLTFASQNRPKDLDVEPGKLSANGLYYAHLQSSLKEIELNQIHPWKVIVVDAKGNPVSHAKLKLSGDMPSHMHGLATEPKIIETTVPGIYQITGMKFQMRGWWVLQLHIESKLGLDTVLYNMDL